MSHLVPVPPIGGHQLLVFLLQVSVLLLVAVLLGRLAVRLGMPALVGELLTGVLLGPSLLGHLSPQVSGFLFPQVDEQFHMLDAVGQIGALLLVGLTGLQLDLKLLRRRSGTALGVSLPGLLIPLGLGIWAGFLIPAAMQAKPDRQGTFALFIGVAMCVSAIPVIAKTLMDLKLIHRNVGQLILVSGTVDDIVGWLLLSVVTATATVGLRAEGVARSVLYLVLFVLGAVVVGRPVVRAVTRVTLRSPEPGTTVACAVVCVLSFAAASHALALEAVFGALVAGMLLRSGGPEALSRLAGLRTFVMSVLAPLFFSIAGLRMDLTLLADPAVLAVGLALLAIAILGKFAGAYMGAWMCRLNRWEALALGAGMNARGVVEVVVAMVGLRYGILNAATFTLIVLIAVVTSVMGPPILRAAAARIEVTEDEQLRRREQEQLMPTEAADWHRPVAGCAPPTTPASPRRAPERSSPR